MEIPTDSILFPEFGSLTKLLIRTGGAVEETLKRCPPQDVANICSIAGLMLGTLLYQTALFSLIGIRLFAAPGQIRPEIILGALAISTFILLIDRYVVVISGYYQQGWKLLAQGGLDISGGVGRRIKGGLFLFIRIGVLSVGLAQLTAIFVGLLVFSNDIHARIERTWLQANGGLISQVTTLIDGSIKRATDAATAQSMTVNALMGQLEALRQNEIDGSANAPQILEAQREVSELIARKAKADDAVVAAQHFADDEFGGIRGNALNSGQVGRGVRYRAAMEDLVAAKNHAQEIDGQLSAARARLDELRKQIPAGDDATRRRAQDQLPAFERTLDVENEKLANLKSDLTKLIAGRDQMIRDAVDNAPHHVSYDDGFLAQIAILKRIAEEDWKIALVIVLIDVVSFGLELAAVLAKVFGFAPTTYEVLLARDAYMQAV